MMKRAKAAEVRTARAAEEKAKLLNNIERTDKVVVRPLAFHAQRLAEPGKTSASGMEARKSAGRSAFPWSGRENRPGGEKNGSGKIKRPEADKRGKRSTMAECFYRIGTVVLTFRRPVLPEGSA